MEFAMARDGAPTILQCRPVTHVATSDIGAVAGLQGATIGRPCAAGRVHGLAVDPAASIARGARPRIAVLGKLTAEHYSIVFDHDGVITEEDASPLSHVAILCRELGVPFVCGVHDARDRFVDRWTIVDGGKGVVAAAGPPTLSAHDAADAGATDASLSTIELLMRALIEGSRSRDLGKEADRIIGGYRKSLGKRRVVLVRSDADASECAALDILGATIFGPGFSAAETLAAWNAAPVDHGR
jgi:phosphohistidine swiveling domain-containing protein